MCPDTIICASCKLAAWIFGIWIFLYLTSGGIAVWYFIRSSWRDWKRNYRRIKRTFVKKFNKIK